jgi:hypothetical protein
LPDTFKSQARYGKWKLCTCVAVLFPSKEYSSIHTRPSTGSWLMPPPYASTSARATLCTRDTKMLPAEKEPARRGAEMVGEAELEDVEVMVSAEKKADPEEVAVAGAVADAALDAVAVNVTSSPDAVADGEAVAEDEVESNAEAVGVKVCLSALRDAHPVADAEDVAEAEAEAVNVISDPERDALVEAKPEGLAVDVSDDELVAEEVAEPDDALDAEGDVEAVSIAPLLEDQWIEAVAQVEVVGDAVPTFAHECIALHHTVTAPSPPDARGLPPAAPREKVTATAPPA